MTQPQLIGLLLVSVAGMLVGAIAWPIKFMRRFRYEHWAFISNTVSLVLLPWIFILTLCPRALTAYAHLPWTLLLEANLFSLAWGIANVLVGLCLVRIGISLTMGLMTSIGLPIGILLPMILRGSGAFAKAPSLYSHTGAVILVGVAALLAATYLTSLAGFGRERALQQQTRAAVGFTGGLIMTVLAGFLQVGLSFAFVYTQADIVRALQGAGTHSALTIIGVWAIVLPGGALVNVLYPAWLLTRRHGWGDFAGNLPEIGLSLLMALAFFTFVISNGLGMRTLGPLGASVGFGVYQGLTMMTSQGIAFGHGEWRGIYGLPRRQIYLALAIFLLAVSLMGYANSLAG